MIEFLDTNPIVRYITQDVPEHAARAKILFDELDAGKRSVTTCEGVLVEVVYLLTSKNLYGRPRSEVRSFLVALLESPGLHILYKRTYLRALDIFASTTLRFVDALCVAHMERDGIQTIISFDRHFDKVANIRRREP